MRRRRDPAPESEIQVQAAQFLKNKGDQNQQHATAGDPQKPGEGLGKAGWQYEIEVPRFRLGFGVLDISLARQVGLVGFIRQDVFDSGIDPGGVGGACGWREQKQPQAHSRDQRISSQTTPVHQDIPLQQ